jgi:putative SOS response-associated peptidase YedK
MPCLLDENAFKAWLDPGRYDAKKFLLPYPGDDLIAERQATPAGAAAEAEPNEDDDAPAEGQLF